MKPEPSSPALCPSKIALKVPGDLCDHLSVFASHRSSPLSGTFTDDERVPRVSRESRTLLKLAELGRSCLDHLLRTKVKPILLDLALEPRASTRPSMRLKELPRQYRKVLHRSTYEKARPTRARLAIRGADPLIRARAWAWVCSALSATSNGARRGRVLPQRDQIVMPRRSESVEVTYTPISDVR